MSGLTQLPPRTMGYAQKSAATMVNGQTIFTVSGPVLILGLVSVCATNNNATASTLQYSIVPTVGAAAQTISGASASLANAAAGASVSLVGTALTTAPSYNANGPNLSMTAPIFCPAGIIRLVVGVGSTTGTWGHYIYFLPLTPSSSVS